MLKNLYGRYDHIKKRDMDMLNTLLGEEVT